MSTRELFIGDKNYSSWSLRAWLAARRCGAFDEAMIWLDRDDSARRLRETSPNAKVPALRDGELLVWESLAICEYLAERHPEAELWPRDPAARAVARSVSSEMHAGFAALRQQYPMNLKARIERPATEETARDIARVCELWRQCRDRGPDGPYLFGTWSIADCMFAPVATRFVTYGVELDEVCAAYRDAVVGHEDMVAWTGAALSEPDRA